MSSYAQSIFIYGSNHSTNTTQQSNIAMYHLIRTILRRKCLMSQWTIPFSHNFIIFINLILATIKHDFHDCTMSESLLIWNTVLWRPYGERITIRFPTPNFWFYIWVVSENKLSWYCRKERKEYSLIYPLSLRYELTLEFKNLFYFFSP